MLLNNWNKTEKIPNTLDNLVPTAVVKQLHQRYTKVDIYSTIYNRILLMQTEKLIEFAQLMFVHKIN